MALNGMNVRSAIGLTPTSVPTNPVNGDFYYDSTANAFEFYQDGAWIEINTGGGANVNLTNLVSPVTPNQNILILDGTVGPTYTFTSLTNVVAFVGDVYTDGTTNYTVQTTVNPGMVVTANGSTNPIYQNYALSFVSGNALSTRTIDYTNYSVPVIPGLGFANEPGSGLFRIGIDDWGLSLNGDQIFEMKTVTAGSYTGNVVAFGPPGSISGDPDTTFAAISNFANPAKFFFSNSNDTSTETGSIIILGVGGTDFNFVTLENWTNNTITHPYLTNCGALYANPNMLGMVIGSEMPTTGFVAFDAGGRLAGNEVMRITPGIVSTSNQAVMLTGDGTTSAPGFAFAAEADTGWMRTASVNPTLIVNSAIAMDVKFVTTNQMNFGFGTTASPSGSNPFTAQTNFAGGAVFQYNNANTGATSSTNFQILNGSPNSLVALNLENHAYTTAGYLAGACVVTAGPDCAPLFLIANEYTSSPNISLAVGGRTAANVALQITSTTITPENGANYVLSSYTTTAKTALTVSAGTVVYDSTLNQMSYYNGSTWVNV